MRLIAGHEMGHRWSAFVSARVNGYTIPLGPTHWARGSTRSEVFTVQVTRAGSR